ncbi:MAG: hypothetical protein A2X81_02710 [Desulfobacterales bacterium GWB2_56_26]|nr:MAG: hypothetical protein A2X81_02710 [Desulfobacterales bacterium GWB2_56_26]
MDIILDAIEVRVLGSLMEKELATPEYYPLSLNGLINACNQKTSRLPVMSLDEGEVAGALQSLKDKRLVFQSDASRVPKYLHNFGKEHNLIRREAALLCTLLLRGPQTAGELRSRTERLCTFDSLEEVGQALDNLSAIGLVERLPRQPGRKEQRYAHLLAGEPENLDQSAAYCVPVIMTSDADNDRLAELEKSVASLKEDLEMLKNEFVLFKKEFQ